MKGTEKKRPFTSPVPDSLVATFTEGELAGVVEYRMTLRTPAAGTGSLSDRRPVRGRRGAALGKDFDPEKGGGPEGRARQRRPADGAGGPTGYFDLAALRGKDAVNSLSDLCRVIESPADQEAMVLLGTDDGCRPFLNGEKVFGRERHEVAAPERDSVR